MFSFLLNVKKKKKKMLTILCNNYKFEFFG